MINSDKANFYLYKIEQFLTELEAKPELEMLRWLDNYLMILETEREQNITLKEKEQTNNKKDEKR